MYYNNEWPRKISYIIIGVCVITTITWFLLFPPVVSHQETFDYSNDKLQSIFENIQSAETVFSVIATKDIPLSTKPTLDEIEALIGMTMTESFYLYSSSLHQFLQPIDKSWAILEQNGTFYMQTNNQKDWLLIDQPISTINPIPHFTIMANNDLEIINLNNNLFYFLEHQKIHNYMYYYYLMKTDKYNRYPLELVIVIYNNKTFNLELIQYHFQDWNELYIKDQIDTQVNYLPK